MKRPFHFSGILVMTFIVLLGLSSKVEASHIPGANITYTCNPANPLEYTFTLTVFRKCPGTHPASMTSSYFSLTNDCGLANPVVPTFNQVGTEQDVNQLCSSATSNCSGGTQPGVWMYTYEATIVLPANCDGWNLAFDLCCRDASSNMSGGSGNSMYCYTELNTVTSPCNNSPVVTAQPIPYACTGTNFNYCLTASDPEGDSISYQMIAPYGAAAAPIAHLAGFSPTQPLNGFTLDPATGCISFNHPNTGNYVVTILITEWDNFGNVVSEIVHDFQIMVINCSNTPPANPVGGITNVSGSASQIGPNNISACYGDNVCFDVVFQDNVDVGDNLTITTDGTTLLPGATFTQTGTNPVTGTFCWTAQPGFLNDVITFVTVDDGCPVMGTTGFAVDFDIETGVYAGPDVYICGTQSAQLLAQGASAYSWSPAIGLSCTNCDNPVAQPLVTTTYVVTGNLTGTCTNTDTITVHVVPDFTITQNPASATICANEIVQLNASGPGLFAPYTWNWDNAGSLNNDAIQDPLAQPLVSTNYTVTMTASTGCTKTSTVPITVSGIGPTVFINPTDTNICEGQSVSITSTAAIYPVSCGLSSGCTGTSSTVNVGTSTSASSTYSPFYGSTSTTTNYTKKMQIIYTAAELNAMGYRGGTIRDFSFFVTSANAYRTDNLQIWMGCTNTDQFANTNFEPMTGMVQVFGPQNNINPADNAWHTFNITDWDWDGTSNIIIQICSEEDNTNDDGSSSVQYSTTTPAYRFNYDINASLNSCGEPTGSRLTSRPNIRFTLCEQSVPSPTYQWVPATNLTSSNTPNTIATPPTSTAYVLNVTASGCTGSGIANINVTPDYTLNASASSTNICYSQSSTLNAITSPGSAGPWTYLWSPATGLNNPNVQSPIATPDITTTYTVVASNGSCEKTASVTINVAGGPANAVVLPQDTVCPYDVVNFDVYTMPAACGATTPGCPAGGSTVVGTSGTNTAATTSYGPFYGSTSTTFVYSYKQQYIFTKQELEGMGFRAGKITSIAFEATTLANRNFDDVTIWMGCTNLSQFANTTFEPTASMTQVDFNATYAASTGWNQFVLDNGFNWDGNSNIIIQVCGEHGDQTGSLSVTYSSTTPAYRQLYDVSSSTPSCNEVTGTRVTNRANIRFEMCYPAFPGTASYVWSPATNLSNPNIANPNCTVTGDYTYTVSVTDPAAPTCPYVGTVGVWVDVSNTVDATPDSTLCASGSANIQLDATYSGSLPPIPKACATGQTCSGTSTAVTIGAGTSATTTYSPFYGSTSTTTNYSKKMQMIYTAAELNAAGFQTGVIRDLSMFVTSTNAYRTDGFTIWMGCTNLNEFPNGNFEPVGGMTQVFGPVNNFNPIDNAWNTFNITDYGWDGTSNIIIQICSREDNTNDDGSSSVQYTCGAGYKQMYTTSTTANACNTATGSRTTCRANMRFNICTEWVPDATYAWSPAGSLNNPNISNPMATVSGNVQYIVTATAGTNCVVYDTVDINVNVAATAPTVAAMPGTYCPNTNMTLTAGGGTAGTSTIEWYTGPNGTGTWLGSGANYTFTPTTSGQTYYARREGVCGVTADDNVTINLKDYIYALNATSTATYCTDNAGWHHFFNGNEIILSVRGDLTGAPAGFPQATIMDNGAYYQQTQGPFTPADCAANSLTPGEERFEMERSWNLDFGGGTLNPPYDVRFYYEPAERNAIEAAAISHMSTYPACGYTYKYGNPNGFYWFKNTGSNYSAPDYDGLHLGAAGGTTPNAVNYGQLNGITSFSGGSGAVIIVPTTLLPVQWLYFDGETDNKVNYLRWATESEQNSDHFNIQRSKDGLTYQTIGAKPGQGTSTTTTHYTYDDVNPYQGLNYYRLELVDADGKVSYSNTIQLFIRSEASKYTFYPNPTNDVVFYQYESGTRDNIRIEVLDVLGKEVFSKEIESVVGINNIPVDLSTYPAGTYMVRVHNEQKGSVHTAKVIKNKF